MSDGPHPKTWREMSLDFRLLLIYHGCMMALFIGGRAIPVQIMLAVVLALVAVLTGVSIRHRRKSGWHWPVIGPKHLAGAITVVLFGLFFLGAMTPRVSPLDPAVLPWFAAGAGIVGFGALSSVRLVVETEAAFQRCCGEPRWDPEEPPVPANREAGWRRAVRQMYSAYFLAVWIAGVSFFWVENTAWRDGTPRPTAERTELLTEHGKTVYITPAQKRAVTLLERTMMIGVPSAILLGLFLQFGVRVNVYPRGGE